MDIRAVLFLVLTLALLAVLLVLGVRWARTRSSGALAFGALMSLFAPDPTLERQIRLTEEAQQQQAEEDEEGEPR
jgi:hypothetical protein